MQHLECSLVDGIIFGDETIQLLNVVTNYADAISYKVSVGIKTSISTLEKEERLWWSSCAVLADLINGEHSLELDNSITSLQ